MRRKSKLKAIELEPMTTDLAIVPVDVHQEEVFCCRKCGHLPYIEDRVARHSCHGMTYEIHLDDWQRMNHRSSIDWAESPEAIEGSMQIGQMRFIALRDKTTGDKWIRVYDPNGANTAGILSRSQVVDLMSIFVKVYKIKDCEVPRR